MNQPGKSAQVIHIAEEGSHELARFVAVEWELNRRPEPFTNYVDLALAVPVNFPQVCLSTLRDTF